MKTQALFKRTQPYRKAVQVGFLLTVIWIGFQFVRFVDQLEAGGPVITARPPGVEAFLPISSLISLKYWILSGTINPIHPAGLWILLMALITGLLLKKGFCSWVCPVGFLSEYLAKLHRNLFGKKIKAPIWLDIPLRSLKYFLLLFFLWAILIQMDERALEMFIYSPYNRVADIKMLKFFTAISTFSLTILVVLVFLSIILRYFWCRYLCPYGALLGFLSLFSMTKIRRSAETCTLCEKCTRVCPSDIRVHQKESVHSDECHACMKCVESCPVPDTLSFGFFQRRSAVKPWAYTGAILFLFLGGSVAARAAGLWQNSIPIPEYVFHVHHLQLPMYQHNRGSVPAYDSSLFPRPGQFRLRKEFSRKSAQVNENFLGDPGKKSPTIDESR